MGSITNRLKEGVRDWYFRQGIPVSSPQLIALSGGADSMALLYILTELCRMSGTGVGNLCAAYYDHNIRSRDELEREIDMIRKRTGEWGIALYLGQAGPGELKERSVREKRSLEDTAREARYEFLERLREETGSSYIVLAHHGNDQAETMITRFFQGAGMAGLKGIDPVAGDRIRPLLSFPKIELIGCLKENGLNWSEDSTNRDGTILRNKLRAGLLPELDRAFPGYETSLINLSEKAARCDDYLSRKGRSVPWVESDGSFGMPCSVFSEIDPAVREYALYHVFDLLLMGTRLSGGKGRRIPYRFIRPLLQKQLAERLTVSGHGLLITVRKERITIARNG